MYVTLRDLQATTATKKFRQGKLWKSGLAREAEHCEFILDDEKNLGDILQQAELKLNALPYEREAKIKAAKDLLKQEISKLLPDLLKGWLYLPETKSYVSAIVDRVVEDEKTGEANLLVLFFRGHSGIPVGVDRKHICSRYRLSPIPVPTAGAVPAAPGGPPAYGEIKASDFKGSYWGPLSTEAEPCRLILDFASEEPIRAELEKLSKIYASLKVAEQESKSPVVRLQDEKETLEELNNSLRGARGWYFSARTNQYWPAIITAVKNNPGGDGKYAIDVSIVDSSTPTIRTVSRVCYLSESGRLASAVV